MTTESQETVVCFDCRHTVNVHDEQGCKLSWSDAGGRGSCACAQMRTVDDPIEAALITIMRHLPRYDHAPVNVICEALGRPVPTNWGRSYKR